jgi:hypothetical protein
MKAGGFGANLQNSYFVAPQARKAEEDAAKNVDRDAMVREAQAKLEAELDFSAFSFRPA